MHFYKKTDIPLLDISLRLSSLYEATINKLLGEEKMKTMHQTEW